MSKEKKYTEADRMKLLNKLESRVGFIKRLYPHCPVVENLRAWVWNTQENFACEVSSRPSGPYVEVRLEPHHDAQFVADHWLTLYQTWLITTNSD